MIEGPQRTKVVQIILVQVVITVVVALAALWFSNIKAGYSSAIGGMICIITNVLFALKFFSNSGASQARAIINAFYYGEALKLILTALLFAGVFYSGVVAALPLFVGFIATQFGNWLAPLVLEKN